MYRRMRACLFGFFEQAERHKLNSEIVLVDWNPPKNKPLLKDAYKWPKHSKYCTIRIIVVPPEIHQGYKLWNKFPVNNDVAKNTAIRRAKGKFILATCIDDLLSNELVSFIAMKRLDENAMYRIDCCNVKNEVVKIETLDDRLRYCRENLIETYPFQPWNPDPLEKQAALKVWDPMPDTKGFPAFYTGRAGDFTLLAKSRWENLRGLPEIDVGGSGSDVFFCSMAYLDGARLEILEPPMRLYHIDHLSRCNSPESNFLTRSGLRSILPESLLTSLRPLIRSIYPVRSEIERAEIPNICWPEIAAQIIDRVKKQGGALFYNNENWGLGKENLKESVVTKTDASL